MSTVEAPATRPLDGPLAVPTARPWLALAALAKAADVLTTVVGLALAGVIEGATLPATAFATIGVVPAVAGLGWLALALIVGGDALVRRWYGAAWALWYRRLAGGLLTVLWSTVAVGNIGLILRVIA